MLFTCKIWGQDFSSSVPKHQLREKVTWHTCHREGQLLQGSACVQSMGVSGAGAWPRLARKCAGPLCSCVVCPAGHVPCGVAVAVGLTSAAQHEGSVLELLFVYLMLNDLPDF